MSFKASKELKMFLLHMFLLHVGLKVFLLAQTVVISFALHFALNVTISLPLSQ